MTARTKGSLMSVALTEAAVVARAKTVTRRMGWLTLQPGARLQLCRKVMGRRAGEPLVRLATVEVVEVRRERLDLITAAEVALEGLAPMTPAEFVEFFCASHKGCTPTSDVTRIRWLYLERCISGSWLAPDHWCAGYAPAGADFCPTCRASIDGLGPLCDCPGCSLPYVEPATTTTETTR